MGWFATLILPRRTAIRAERLALEAFKRVHRLEIDLGQALDKLAALERRMNGKGGIAGGRPPKAPAAPAGTYERLEDIPTGDKKALRAWFLAHPPADAPRRPS